MVLAVADASDDTMWFPPLRDVLALEPVAIGEPDVVGSQAGYPYCFIRIRVRKDKDEWIMYKVSRIKNIYMKKNKEIGKNRERKVK